MIHLNTEVKKMILLSCQNANIAKLQDILSQTWDENQRKQIKSMFDNHIKQIADFCEKDFFNNDLTQDFIKKLHEIHYPKWYILFKKTADGKWKVAIMIPGQYKTIDNFQRVKASQVKEAMNEVVEKFNNDIKITNDHFTCISQLIIDLFRIHPFGNWNGCVISILYDLLLIKYHLPPVYLKWFYVDKSLKKEIYLVIENSILKKDISSFKNLIWRLTNT